MRTPAPLELRNRSGFSRFGPLAILRRYTAITMIEYRSALDGIGPENLRGFFQGWPNPPSPATHLEVLRGSHCVWLAMHADRCVGFVNALSDGMLCAFIPLLEVLPEYQGQGIGRELLRRMKETLADVYSIDIVCDPAMLPFYERQGFTPLAAAALRNRDCRQLGYHKAWVEG